MISSAQSTPVGEAITAETVEPKGCLAVRIDACFIVVTDFYIASTELILYFLEVSSSCSGLRELDLTSQ